MSLLRRYPPVPPSRHPGGPDAVGPARHRRPPRWRGLALAVGAATVAWGLALGGSGARATPALASVVHHVGFEATVLGWSSWYGDYDLGSVGTGWCIDHGLHAPDPAFGYRPTVPTDLRDDTRAAMAWAVSVDGPGADPVRSAALMLVLHDLRGAVYPFGRLDVDTLTTGDLSGFAGHEAEVIATAQAIKADALAHAARRGPLALTVVTQSTGPASGLLVVTVADATGAPVPGAAVAVSASGAALGGSTTARSDGDGRVSVPFDLPVGWPAGAGPVPVVWFAARAVVPDPTLSTWASSTVAAQRIVVPSWLTLTGSTSLTRPSAPTTSPPTTSPPTTSPAVTSSTTTTTAQATTSSTTTSTVRPTTTTTTRPAATTSTVRPTTSTTSRPAATTSTVRPTTTSTPSPTSSAPGPASTTVASAAAQVRPSSAPSQPMGTAATLPVTGAPTAGWALISLGLVLVGAALISTSRQLDRSRLRSG
jgi:hypothetical protein